MIAVVIIALLTNLMGVVAKEPKPVSTWDGVYIDHCVKHLKEEYHETEYGEEFKVCSPNLTFGPKSIDQCLHTVNQEALVEHGIVDRCQFMCRAENWNHHFDYSAEDCICKAMEVHPNLFREVLTDPETGELLLEKGEVGLGVAYYEEFCRCLEGARLGLSHNYVWKDPLDPRPS